MAFETGSNFSVSLLEETNPGVKPVSGNPLPLRTTGGNTMELRKEILESAELRSDEQRAVVRHGNKSVDGELPFELSNQDFDIPLQAVMGGTWTKAIDLDLDDLTVASAGKTITSAATNFETAGVEIGDRITFTNFVEAGNNSTFTVSAVSTTVMTFSTATGMVNESPTTTVTVDSDRYYIIAGTTHRSFTIQKFYASLAGNKWEHFVGCYFNTMALTVAPNAITSGSFSIMGFDKDTDQAASFIGTPVAPTTNQPYDSYTGYLKIGGTAIAVATSVDISMSRGTELAHVIGSPIATAALPARFTVDLTMDAYLEDFSYITNFEDETETTFELELGFETEFLRITLPRVKPTGADVTVPNEQGIVQNLSFQALYDTTSGYNIRMDASSINLVGI